MDTLKTMQAKESFEQSEQYQQQVQQQQKQEDMISQDWVNVSAEESTKTQVSKFKISEGVNINEPEAQKAMNDLLLYEPIHLTKKELKNITRDEIRKDKSVKAGDLENMNFRQLADWALINAKARGADSSFLKLVDNLVNINTLSKNLSTGTSFEVLSECRKQFDIALSELEGNVSAYHDSHNKLIVFTQKGRLRLELCRVLKAKLDGGLLDELRRQADFDAESQVVRLEREKEAGFELSKDYSLESDAFVQIVEPIAKGRWEGYGELKKNPQVRKFESTVASSVSQISRRQMLPLFKYGEENAEEWNQRVIEAATKFNESGDDTSLDGIFEDIVAEICRFKPTPEMVDMDYCVKHPEAFLEINRLGCLYGDFMDKNSFNVFPKVYERVLSKNASLKEKFHKIGQCVTDLSMAQTAIFLYRYAIDLNSMLGCDSPYRIAGTEYKEQGEAMLVETSERNREMIAKCAPYITQ